MSVNLGSDAIGAIHELRGNHHFETLISAFGVFAQQLSFRSLGSEKREDATAYARGIYEVWVAMHAAHTGLHQTQVKPPSLAKGKVVETSNAQ